MNLDTRYFNILKQGLINLELWIHEQEDVENGEETGLNESWEQIEAGGGGLQKKGKKEDKKAKKAKKPATKKKGGKGEDLDDDLVEEKSEEEMLKLLEKRH